MKTYLKSLRIGVALATLMLTSTLVMAQSATGGQSAGQIAGNIATSMTGIGSAVQTFCWVMAFIVGCAAAFKFWAYAKDQDREKLSTPFMLIVVAAIFYAIPMLLSSSASTVWGNGTITTSQSGAATSALTPQN